MHDSGVIDFVANGTERVMQSWYSGPSRWSRCSRSKLNERDSNKLWPLKVKTVGALEVKAEQADADKLWLP